MCTDSKVMSTVCLALQLMIMIEISSGRFFYVDAHQDCALSLYNWNAQISHDGCIHLRATIALKHTHLLLRPVFHRKILWEAKVTASPPLQLTKHTSRMSKVIVMQFTTALQNWKSGSELARVTAEFEVSTDKEDWQTSTIYPLEALVEVAVDGLRVQYAQSVFSSYIPSNERHWEVGRCSRMQWVFVDVEPSSFIPGHLKTFLQVVKQLMTTNELFSCLANYVTARFRQTNF